MKKFFFLFLIILFLVTLKQAFAQVDPEAKVNLLVNGSHGPIDIYYGDTAQVSWTSTKTANCAVNWPLPDNIIQSTYGPSGTQTTVPITERGTIYFTVMCSVPTGGSVLDTVVINIINRPPTPIPTSTPTIIPTNIPTQILTVAPTNTPTPTTNPCPKKSQGDANCDNKIDLLDFNVWRSEFLAYNGTIRIDGTKNADFNNDGVINLLDFNIWRSSFLSL